MLPWGIFWCFVGLVLGLVRIVALGVFDLKYPPLLHRSPPSKNYTKLPPLLPEETVRVYVCPATVPAFDSEIWTNLFWIK